MRMGRQWAGRLRSWSAWMIVRHTALRLVDERIKREETTSWRGISSTTTVEEEEEGDNGKREISMDEGPWGPVTSRLWTSPVTTLQPAPLRTILLPYRADLLPPSVRPPHVLRRANKIAIWTYQLCSRYGLVCNE